MALTTQDLIAIIRTRGRGDPPSALADIFVNPVVKSNNFLSTKVDLARTEQTVDSILTALANTTTIATMATILGDTEATVETRLRHALEEIASNFGITRRLASPSRGTVLLLKRSIGSEPIQIPSGRKVSAPSVKQDYRITQTITVSPNSLTYDPIRLVYTISAPVESINTGLATTTAAETVTKIKDPITGIDGVTNISPILGGRDEESDVSLGNRTKASLNASSTGTTQGYRETVLSLSQVKDTTIIGAGDPLMIRDHGDGGSVDIYVVDAITLEITEVMTTAGTEFIPSRQPLGSVLSSDIRTSWSAGAITVTIDASYYNGSKKAVDKIIFANAFGANDTVTYLTNDLVAQVQDYIDEPSRQQLGADILVKQGIVVLVDIQFRLVVLTGFDASTVKANVEAALTQLVANLGIARALELSDVIRVATNIDGVDRLDLPPIYFNRVDDISASWVNVITVQGNEVLRPGNIEMVL